MIDKSAIGSVLASDLDTAAVGLVDRAMFSAIRERAILFRLKGLRRTGFNIRSILTGAAGMAWVAPGKPIPVFKPSIDNVGLDPFKLCGMTVVTESSLQAAPGLEEALFNDLAQAYADAVDEALLDPANEGSANEKPASITNGVFGVPATSDPAADLAALFAAFTGNLAGAYFTMTPELATKLAGTGLYRDIGARGGDLMGVPVLVGRKAPSDSIALIDPSGIMAAYDDDVLLETGREGSVEMDTAPANDSVAPNPAQLVSLFQLNLRAFRAVGRVAWTEARPGSVALLQGGGSDWLA
jgi:hypothetical protein